MGIDMSNVGLPEMSLVTWILALLPVVVVLALMMVFKMSGARAGFISWLVALAVVFFAFGGGAEVLAAVDGCPDKPGFFVLFACKLRLIPKIAQENLLVDIIGVLLIAQIGISQLVHGFLIFFYQGFYLPLSFIWYESIWHESFLLTGLYL